MLSLSGRMGDIYFQLLEKYLNYLLVSHEYIKDIQVTIARRFHLFPFRTEKLSFVTPMVLRKSGRVGSRRLIKAPRSVRLRGFFYVYTERIMRVDRCRLWSKRATFVMNIDI